MPGVRTAFWGNFQYATAAEGYGQLLWAQAWQQANWAAIRPGWTLDLVALLEPTEAGGNVQLNFELHFETATQAETDALMEGDPGGFHGHLSVGATDETTNVGPE